MSNPHQELARWKKAGAIADMFERLATQLLAEFDSSKPKHWSLLVASVAKAEPLCWRQVAVMAGQRPPSEKTQAVVIEILRSRQQTAGVDPFAGVSP